MSNQEFEILFKSILQLAIISAVFIALFLIAIKLAKSLLIFIDKKRLLLKLRKYDLAKYDIHFDSKGMPTVLVEKTNNKIIFI